MVYRKLDPAPASRVAPERRGPIVGRFCLSCTGVYPLHAAKHAGKGLYTRDHVSSPCAHEGELFVAGATWWEPAVEVLPAPPAPAPAAPQPGAPPPAAPPQAAPPKSA